MTEILGPWLILLSMSLYLIYEIGRLRRELHELKMLLLGNYSALQQKRKGKFRRLTSGFVGGTHYLLKALTLRLNYQER